MEGEGGRVFCTLYHCACLQVFDIALNGQHTVLKDFDIFGKVGKAAALDEVVPFSVQGSHLSVGGETSDFDGNLRVEFLKVREGLCRD